MNWYKLSKKVKHNYSWCYIDLPTKIQDQLINFGKQIDPDDLYIKEAEDGLETEPHCTVKYALLTDEVKDIREILKKEKKGKFYLGKSTIFEKDKYDVVKIEVESEDLKRVHERLNNLPHEDKYPEYKAHATIAYLKKGKGKKYIGKFKIDKSIKFDELFFENTKDKNYKIKLARVSNVFNLYKKSQQNQQEEFSFVSEIPNKKQPPTEETEQYKKLVKQTPEVFFNIIEKCSDLDELSRMLGIHGFEFKRIKDIISVKIGKEVYIVDESMSITRGEEWIWTVRDIDEYINFPDFNEQFWKSPSTVYHQTSSANWPLIQKNGLQIRDTKRGINNRGTGLAIFTSTEPDELDSYGDIMIEINTEEMKKDGYMPTVSAEKPFVDAEKNNALAHLIGLNYFSDEWEQAISPNTVIFYKNIPSKYLRIL